MVSVIESEQLGMAFNMLESLNEYMIENQHRTYALFYVYEAIGKVIEFMDKVVA